MLSDITTAEAAQHTQLITLNHSLCCLLLCRDIMGNKRRDAFSGGGNHETKDPEW